MFHLSKINAAYRALGTNDHNSGLKKRSTENLICKKFTQSKFSAKKVQTTESRAKMVFTTNVRMVFCTSLRIYKFTSPCKLVRKCGVYHLCL